MEKNKSPYLSSLKTSIVPEAINCNNKRIQSLQSVGSRNIVSNTAPIYKITKGSITQIFYLQLS